MAAKTLLVTHIGFFDIDRLVSAVVLGKVIARELSTQVELLVRTEFPAQKLQKVADTQGINLITKIPVDPNTLIIQNLDSQVESLRWIKEDNNLKIVMEDATGNPISTEQAKVATSSSPYERIVALCLNSRESLNKEIAPIQISEFSGEIQTIHQKKPQADLPGTEHLYLNTKTYTETVVSHIIKQEWLLKPNEATELLAAIHWKTNSFKNYFTEQNTLETASKLLELGASLPIANNKIYHSLLSIEREFNQQAFNEFVIEDNLGFAQIDRGLSKRLADEDLIHPQLSTIFDSADLDAVFILLPVEPNKTEVWAGSYHKDVNFKKVFQEFGLKGNNLQVKFSFDLDVTASKNKIKELLGKTAKQEEIKEDNDQANGSAENNLQNFNEAKPLSNPNFDPLPPADT